MKKFSKSWVSSKKPRKQRKYRVNAPLHIKGRFMAVHLSQELIKKYNRRSVRVRTGDRVRILRGKFKKTNGRVEKVNVVKQKIFVSGAEKIKKDGSKTFYPINPSNVLIKELKLEDKKRIAMLERTKRKKDAP